MTIWIIFYKGKNSKEQHSLECSNPESIYDLINYIGTKDNLEFQKVRIK